MFLFFLKKCNFFFRFLGLFRYWTTSFSFNLPIYGLNLVCFSLLLWLFGMPPWSPFCFRNFWNTFVCSIFFWTFLEYHFLFLFFPANIFNKSFCSFSHLKVFEKTLFFPLWSRRFWKKRVHFFLIFPKILRLHFFYPLWKNKSSNKLVCFWLIWKIGRSKIRFTFVSI